jgi:hypothetical protein
MFQTDSISHSLWGLSDSANVQTPKVHRQPTPAQVLSWLPRNATPQQQDSAIQANITPSEIHWSSRPDTLHLPGQSVGKSFRDVSLPQYYKHSYFSKSPLFHPEISGGRQGVSGDPIPYTIAGDNLITSILLGCFVLTLTAYSVSRGFIERQVKKFFYVQHGKTTAVTETASELRFQLFLVLQTSLLQALVFFFYNSSVSSDTYVLEQYQVIGIYGAMFACYYAFKFMMYFLTNMVFFDKGRNEQWLKSFLFIISSTGLLLFPAVMLLAYFDMAIKTVAVYALVVIVLSKVLTFFKTYIIFFRQNGRFLQNILYFCALEIMPLLSMLGVMITANSYLKVNY